MFCVSYTRLWFQRQTHVLGFNEEKKIKQGCVFLFNSVRRHLVQSWQNNVQKRSARLRAHREEIWERFSLFWLLTFRLKQRQLSFRMPLSMTAGVTNPYITQRCLVYAQCKGQRSYCRPRLPPVPRSPSCLLTCGLPLGDAGEPVFSHLFRWI